ncbi:hypothetical protein CGRA01v4_05935 [Colletotrichum graminicola]|uniref:Uncharacterized protein n=1 Tax=Colletotrichum graminicola (strain M1.001 / M2 / FGSC 10212) TaxID=645133 RepID=E3QNL4_COLGM|nr:uncharacterized protein GLRG_07771 [Colletotrichum graminicola M1.001]EFQ32501.1 hypothetical protein GLRG_07771 [Colletotrichum graminicola M1.001]WDK14653.1 hypothetical protein CGRA01v4_05935 [Colletotrichum graminicola]
MLPAVLVSPEFHNGIHDVFSRSCISTRSDAYLPSRPPPPPVWFRLLLMLLVRIYAPGIPSPVSMKGSRDTQTRRFHPHDVCDFCILMRINALYAVIESRVKKKKTMVNASLGNKNLACLDRPLSKNAVTSKTLPCALL